MAIHSSRRFGFCTPLFLFSILALIAAAPATQPSTDAVSQLLQTHDYPAALRMTNKLLSLNDSTAQAFDPYQLQTLKGEAYIGMKSTDAAIGAFTAAAKATSDPHELAVAKCTVLLLKNSNSATYIPKTAPAGAAKPGPIPLADLDQRPAAFTALLDDQLTAMQPKIDAAAKSPSLQPIYPLLQQLTDMQDLDRVANGSDDRTAKISASLLDHAHNMIVTALKGMWGRLDEISNSANQTTINTQVNPLANSNTLPGNGAVTTVQKAGLSDDNKTELKNMIDTCGKIHQAADAFMALSANDKDKQWATVTSDAGRISGRANDLLNFNFTNTYSYSSNPGYVGYSGALPGGVIAPGYNPVGQQVIIIPSGPVPPVHNVHAPTTNKSTK